MKRQAFAVLVLLCLSFIQVSAQEERHDGYKMQAIPIKTRWAMQVNSSNVLPEYPRPQLVRSNWVNLNGLWEYAITDTSTTLSTGTNPSTVLRTKYEGKILVPYPVESALSGVKKRVEPHQLIWYRRNIIRPTLKKGEKVLLHFDAVDFEAIVYLNGKEIGNHKGGYQNFSFDITNDLRTGNNELVVKVWDPSDQGPNPHGKQVLNPEGIMYTPSSGIWQTVWLETVPANYVEGLTIIPDVDAGVVKIRVKSSSDDAVQIEAAGQIIKGQSNTNITVPVKNARLWSPDDPYLYDMTVRLGTDVVKSYFGMRKIEIKKDARGRERIFLNEKYYYNLGTLDQGFWPDGLYTAPTDEALKFDIIAAKTMGFNTIRKHIKIEPARWYYHADKIGMLVWQDMVNPGNDTKEGRDQFEKECAETIAQLYNYPCITTWVLFNEKWGQYDQERLTKWMKQTDPTRLVNGHSGEMLYVNDRLRSESPNAWVGADMTDVHAYSMPGHIKYQTGKAAVLGEFGGIGVPIEGHLWDDLVAGWGYDGVVTPSKMKVQYTQMVDSLKMLEHEGLSASIYTQPFDVESEQNGIITYDREIVKLPITTIRSIHERLWPATKNIASAMKGFKVKVADTLTLSYEDKLNQFRKGNRSQDFLRNLAILAFQRNNISLANEIGNEYIKNLNGSFDNNQLSFIIKFTSKGTDAGYVLLVLNMNRFKGKEEYKTISQKIQEIYFKENVRTLLVLEPDWGRIDSIINKYSLTESKQHLETLIWLFYGNEGLQGKPLGTVSNVFNSIKRFDDKYRITNNYNQWAWYFFEKSFDRIHLEKSLEWSKKSIDLEPNQPAYLDTYANLLYKLGRKEDALRWQQRAVAADPNNDGIKLAYEKMKKGEPTWPVNQ